MVFAGENNKAAYLVVFFSRQKQVVKIGYIWFAGGGGDSIIFIPENRSRFTGTNWLLYAAKFMVCRGGKKTAYIFHSEKNRFMVCRYSTNSIMFRSERQLMVHVGNRCIRSVHPGKQGVAGGRGS